VSQNSAILFLDESIIVDNLHSKVLLCFSSDQKYFSCSHCRSAGIAMLAFIHSFPIFDIWSFVNQSFSVKIAKAGTHLSANWFSSSCDSFHFACICHNASVNQSRTSFHPHKAHTVFQSICIIFIAFSHSNQYHISFFV
jgi:hypothetical protein